MRFGAHVSAAGGLEPMLDYARSVGCECLQLFAKSPRRWAAPPVDRDEAERFVDALRTSGFGPVYTHTAYLLNLSTSDPDLRARSIRALADEIERACVLGAAGVVTHIGTAPDGNASRAAARAAESICRAVELVDGPVATRVLIENSAGAGSTFGAEMSALADVIERSGLPASLVGICLDTCHAFAFGYPLDTDKGWSDLLDAVAASCGLDRLGLIHANDCAFPRGSRRDRHAWIGEGAIGAEGFRAMVREPRLQRIDAITEMPGEIPEKDRVNIDRLRALRAEADV